MVDFEKLSPEEKEAIRAKILAEEKDKEDQKKKERAAYKEMKNEVVLAVFDELEKASKKLEESKAKIYNEFGSLEDLKAKHYGIKPDQRSHTWTSEDGKKTIITGYNVKDGWDETKDIGLAKVNEWIENQMDDKNTFLIKMLRELLKANENGDLNANRVLTIRKSAEEAGEKELIEAVNIIMDSHKLVKTNTFIKAQYVDDHGVKKWLPLSFSNIS
jgi:hypothetical protein